MDKTDLPCHVNRFIFVQTLCVADTLTRYQDAIFEMSVPLALDYTGVWVDGCAYESSGVLPCDQSSGVSARHFEITITVGFGLSLQ